MNHRAVQAWLALVASCAAAAFTPQQTPPRDTAKVTAGTGTVRGRVTDKATGQPIPRASVEMMLQVQGSTGQRYRTATSPDGRYEFPDVPAGEYYINANAGENRSGYLPQALGEGAAQAHPFGRPPLVELKPGEVRSDADFALARSFAIGGRVVNEYGEGLADARVSVEWQDGTPVASWRSTDDRGDFRLFGLRPGDYRVCASPSDSADWVRPTEGDALHTRYFRTCVPRRGSAPISIASADVDGVLVQMRRGRGLALSGRVVTEAGGRPENLQIHLTQIEGIDWLVRRVPLTVDGNTFSARGVPPGEYILRAAVTDRQASAPRELASVPLTLDVADVTDLVVVMSAGVSVAGRVVVDADAPPVLRGERIAVRASRDTDGERVYRQDQSVSAAVREDMTFELTRVHGPIVIGVSGLPDGWVLKSVRYRGTEITDVATQFASGTTPRDLEVTVTNRSARLVVRMSADESPRGTRAVPVLIPVDPARWKAGITAPPYSAPSRDGTLAFPPVRPGEYFVAAVIAEHLQRLRRDLTAIKAVASAAQRVRLVEHETHTADVRLVPLPEDR